MPRLAALALPLAALLPATASAATNVSLNGFRGDVQVSDTGVEPNLLRIAVSADGRTVRVEDDGGPVSTVSTGCLADGGAVVCAPPAPLTAVWVFLGDGDDRAEVNGPVAAHLVGGPGRDELLGGDGDDVLTDEDGAPSVPDVLDGRGGRDLLDLSTEAGDRHVDLDEGYARVGGVADVVRGVEDVRGSDGDDVLFGDASPNTLEGGRGDDRLEGGWGADELHGGDGDDAISGGFGPDRLGGPEEDGDDRLSGGLGRDRLVGAAGADRLLAGAGDRAWPGYGVDRVTLRPGGRAATTRDLVRDRIACRRGGDLVADVGDAVSGPCRVDARAVKNAVAGAPTAIPWALRPPFEPRMACEPFLPERLCRGTVELRRAGRTIARGTYRYGSLDGELLPRGVQRALAAGRRVRVALHIRPVPPGLPGITRFVLLPPRR